MTEILHTADRFLIHFYASAGVVLAVLFTISFIQRRKGFPWLPVRIQGQIFVSALVVFAASTLREAYDISQGGTLVKSIFDYISWAGGCGCSAWALLRIVRR